MLQSRAELMPIPFLCRYDPLDGPQFLADLFEMRKGKWARLTADQQFLRSEVCRKDLDVLDLGDVWRAEAETKDGRLPDDARLMPSLTGR